MVRNTVYSVPRFSDKDYLNAVKGAAFVNRSDLGCLYMKGRDALDLLERLSTNQLSNLQVGECIPTVFTSNKGRIIDLVLVIRNLDYLLLLTGAETHNEVTEWINFYTVTEDVVTENMTDCTGTLSIIGASSGEVLGSVFGLELSHMSKYETIRASWDHIDATILRTDSIGYQAYEIIVAETDIDPIRKKLKDSDAFGYVGPEVFEAIRVERGIPLSGNELCKSYNPLEAGLTEYISFTKGCYIGQEVIARLNTYDKVQKCLVGLMLDSKELPDLGLNVLSGTKKIGTLTSAAYSPILQRNVGLGYVKKMYANPGTYVSIQQGEAQIIAQIREIPSGIDSMFK